MKNLPFFVYGTLRRGLRNYESYLKGKTDKEISAVTTGRMTVVEHGAFPCLFPEGDDVIKGELMYVPDDLFPDILEVLDWLEGYDEANPEGSMYIRKIVSVKNQAGQYVKAYIYYWNRNSGTGDYIPGGCWVSHVTENAAKTKQNC